MIDVNECFEREPFSAEGVNILVPRDITKVWAVISSRELIAKCLQCEDCEDCLAKTNNVRRLDENITNGFMDN